VKKIYCDMCGVELKDSYSVFTEEQRYGYRNGSFTSVPGIIRIDVCPSCRNTITSGMAERKDDENKDS